MTTNDQIKQARQQAGMTQQASATLCNVSLRTWQNWEYGVHKMPDAIFKYYLQVILR